MFPVMGQKKETLVFDGGSFLCLMWLSLEPGVIKLSYRKSDTKGVNRIGLKSILSFFSQTSSKSNGLLTRDP